jgi:hypothetical protein
MPETEDEHEHKHMDGGDADDEADDKRDDDTGPPSQKKDKAAPTRRRRRRAPSSAATGAFYKLIFEAPSKKAQPLCRDIFQQTGAWTSGNCDQAAAYTIWSLTFSDNVDAVYTEDGTKTAITCHITSSVTLPEWHKVDATITPDDRAEIMRVCIRTAHHEAGHRQSPEAMAAAIDRFCTALPAAIPRGAVKATNCAVSKVIRGFYEHIGRNMTDVIYDAISRHGYIQGAVFNKKVDKQADNRTIFTHDDDTLVSVMSDGLTGGDDDTRSGPDPDSNSDSDTNSGAGSDFVAGASHPKPRAVGKPKRRRRVKRGLKCSATGTCPLRR